MTLYTSESLTLQAILELFDEPPDEPARHDLRPGEVVRVRRIGWGGEGQIVEVRGDHVGFGDLVRGPLVWFTACEVERVPAPPRPTTCGCGFVHAPGERCGPY